MRNAGGTVNTIISQAKFPLKVLFRSADRTYQFFDCSLSDLVRIHIKHLVIGAMDASSSNGYAALNVSRGD